MARREVVGRRGEAGRDGGEGGGGRREKEGVEGPHDDLLLGLDLEELEGEAEEVGGAEVAAVDPLWGLGAGVVRCSCKKHGRPGRGE